MTKNTKALLLSALVFPGIGQFYLKRYKSACIFIGVALASTIYIFVDIMTIALAVADKIVTGEISADYSTMRKAIFEAQESSGTQIITILIYVLVATWIISIIDILRLKKQQK